MRRRAPTNGSRESATSRRSSAASVSTKRFFRFQPMSSNGTCVVPAVSGLMISSSAHIRSRSTIRAGFSQQTSTEMRGLLTQEPILKHAVQRAFQLRSSAPGRGMVAMSGSSSPNLSRHATPGSSARSCSPLRWNVGRKLRSHRTIDSFQVKKFCRSVALGTSSLCHFRPARERVATASLWITSCAHMTINGHFSHR